MRLLLSVIGLLVSIYLCLPNKGRAETSGAYLAGQQALRAENFVEAASYLTEVLALDPDQPELRQSLVLASALAGDLDAAALQAEPLLQAGLQDEIPQLVTFVSLIRQVSFTDALQQLTELPNPLIQEVGKVWIMASLGDFEAALRVLEDRSGSTAHRLLRSYLSGCLEFLRGQKRRALEHFEFVAGMSSGLKKRALLAQVEILWSLGKKRDALDFLQDHKDFFHDYQLPTDNNLGLGLPKVLPRSTMEGFAEAFHAMSYLLAEDSMQQRRLLFRQISLSLAPHQPLLLLTMAQEFEQMGHTSQARGIYETLRDDPHVGWFAHVELAYLNADAGDHEGAILILMPFTQSAFQARESFRHIGNIYRMASQFDEAVKAYENALKLSQNDDWLLHFVYAVALERSGQWPEAERALKQALALEPDQPQVMNYLGYSWADQGVNLYDALQLLNAAVKLRPEDGFIMDSLAWAYFKLGRMDDALTTIEQARALEPSDPTITEHHGDILHAMGFWRQASHMWERARRSFEMKKDQERVIEKLKGLPKL